MKRAFLDSSVLVAACASKTGASAFVLGYCRRRKIKGFVSLDVIGEARKNVLLKLKESGRERLVYFLKPSVIKFAKPLKVLTPGEFVLKCLK